MLNSLRATTVKKNEINNNIFKLQKNTPKQISKQNNSHSAHIHEENEGETCFVHSTFSDDAIAMICNEFYLSSCKNPKRLDLSYYYFAKDKTIMIYLYDMKKIFAGVHNIIRLIEQWKSGICYAKYCTAKISGYQLSDDNIHLGVITENNDIERRNRELQPILHPEPSPGGLPSFISSKHRANTADQISKAKVLTGFDVGNITIGGITYSYDVRTFVDKKHYMYFNDGILEQQIVE